MSNCQFSLFAVTCLLIWPLLHADSIKCPLDPLLNAPANWQMTPDDFEKSFSKDGNKLFRWLAQDRSRAKITRKLYSNLEIELSAFAGEVPVQEAIIDFADGRLNLISISIYNRADSGDISKDAFAERFKQTGKAMGAMFGESPRSRKADAQNGLLTEGYAWEVPRHGIALLEHNEGAMGDAKGEFLRLRVARPDATGSLAASMYHSRGGAAMRQRDLPGNVRKTESGDVMIANLPMVDQGDKGYCVVASAQRVFEYYGIGADMHQIAEIAGSDPKRGTSTLEMSKELGKIDYRFKTRLTIIGMGKPLTEVIKKRDEYYVGKPVDERKFLKEIRTYIDSGIPLLWSLELGLFPENPQLSLQADGGHMRTIIGYNDKTEDIVFSDSWGFGHEAKRMKMSDSYKASHGLFVLKPTVQ